MAASALSRNSVSRALSIVLILGLISSTVVSTIYVIESHLIFWRDSSIVGEQ
jgi:Na+-transporting NADH:ubiquinone oxidoreductase subunit NqrC